MATLRWGMALLVAAAGAMLVVSGPTGLAARVGTLAPPASVAEAGLFYGVAATSSDNAWAVGGSRFATYLIMHWNGSRWTVSHFGHGQPVTEFAGVAATSAGNAWAVGSIARTPGIPHTLAEHWNGKAWKWFYTPTPGGNALLNGVAATSASNAWAVGAINSGRGRPLIEHWNGRTWTQARYPATTGAVLHAVAATSARNAWAVGSTRANSHGSGQTTLIEHWNGTRWTRVPSPNAADRGSLLQGVTATGPDNAWADGLSLGSTTEKSLILHWNGKRWSLVHSPNPTGDTDLIGIAAASSGDAWAVGYTNPSRCGHGPKCGTAAFHWNGKTWVVTPSVNPPAGYLNEFAGVAVTAAGNAWAVGSTDWGATLIEHWNGKTWTWLPE
jgi:hypothetical protein